MRKLWTDHVVWTRDYIVAAVGDQPDAQAAAARLLKNQEDIGAAIAGFYGKPAGDKLTALLKEHITIAVDLIKAAKAGDKAAQQQADAKWKTERRRHCGLPVEGEPELAARDAGRHDEQAPVDDHGRSRGAVDEELGRRRPRVRRRLQSHPDDVRRA